MTHEGDDIVQEMGLAHRHPRQPLMLDMHHMHVKVICPISSVLAGQGIQYEG